MIKNRFYILQYFIILLIFSCKSDPKKLISNTTHIKGMKLIPAGTLHMGGDNSQADANEYPKHDVAVSAFYIDETEVTNAEFKVFADATKYITVAERPIDWEEMKSQLPPDTPKPADSLLMPGSLVFVPTKYPVPLDNPQLWWRWTIGADWKHPEGPNTDIQRKMNHPVVHIAYEDAQAYCLWAGKRLPSEAEWEWAARGGKSDMVYPWGNDGLDDKKANFFQGVFPAEDKGKDGYKGTAPVKSYQPNGYGLYDMAGNVWEWCEDWFDTAYYNKKEASKDNTSGPTVSFNPAMPYQKERIIRGGSFLCNDSYCSGYRNARRMGSSPDTGLNHTGFRCAKDIEK